MDAVAGNFHRGTHRAARIEVEAETVAVALHRAAPVAAYRQGDLAVIAAALDRVDLHHRLVAVDGGTDFARVHAVVGIERRLDTPQFVEQRFAEERRAVLRAESLAVFAPE